MLDKPNLPDESIIARLNAHYDLSIHALEFLPVGNDQYAYAYRARGVSGDYFLKLRRGQTRLAALIAPHELNRLGIAQPVAPMTTSSGDLMASGDDFDLILYPYIIGESAWGMRLSPSQARKWGEIMRRIHSAPLTDSISQQVPREIFGSKWLATLDRVEAILASGDYSGGIAVQLAQTWRERAAEITGCRRRFVEIGAELAADPPPFLLCHADIHTANIIIAADERIRIVDWDEAVIAPKERDLMFFLLDGHESAFEEAFFQGYGGKDINWLALAYYKYDWVIQEFADYGMRVFLAADLGERDLIASLREFQRLFEPGDVIERAHQAFAMCQAVHFAAQAMVNPRSAQVDQPKY